MDEALKQELQEKRKYCVVKRDDPHIVHTTQAEFTAHILRGLISYHERMTIGLYPDRDFYKNSLKYALELVEREIEAQREPESSS